MKQFFSVILATALLFTKAYTATIPPTCSGCPAVVKEVSGYQIGLIDNNPETPCVIPSSCSGKSEDKTDSGASSGGISLTPEMIQKLLEEEKKKMGEEIERQMQERLQKEKDNMKTEMESALKNKLTSEKENMKTEMENALKDKLTVEKENMKTEMTNKMKESASQLMTLAQGGNVNTEAAQAQLQQIAIANGKNKVAVSKHRIDGQGNLICNSCTIHSTGTENYYGYEDDEICTIDNVVCKLAPIDREKVISPPQRAKDGVLICNFCEFTEIRKDNSTWAKQNGEDCRVVGSRCNLNNTPFPWCKNCVVSNYADDGNAYGYENDTICLVNEISCGLAMNPNADANESAATNLTIRNALYFIASLFIIFFVRF